MQVKLARGHRHIVLVAALVGVLVGIASASAASAATRPSQDFVYTCEWIEAHPAEAARAMVTCDAAVFFAESTQGPALSALKEGDSSTAVFEDGCQHLPIDPGGIGQGVFGWTSYKYTKQWSWTDQTNPTNYTWYLQTTGGTYTWGDYSGAWTSHGPVNVPANEYRWGAQNHSASPARWLICWNDD